MDPGALEPMVNAFIDTLTALGHTPLTVENYANAARHLGVWLIRSKIDLPQLGENVVERFARHQCRCPGGRRKSRLSAKYVRRARRFVRFLAEHGVIPELAPRRTRPLDRHVAAYQDWLRRHRGISERSIDRHGRMIMRLIPQLGDRPEAYDATVVRQVVIEEAKRSSRAHVKTMTTALRGYLRFLAARGRCRPWLDRAVPTIPQWRLSALPRYISGGDGVEPVDAGGPGRYLLRGARSALPVHGGPCVRYRAAAWR
jgi:site-specific recombinase XerC